MMLVCQIGYVAFAVAFVIAGDVGLGCVALMLGVCALGIQMDRIERRMKEVEK